MKSPIPNSYWVEPGRLLAGEHPWGGSPAATGERIGLLLDAGVQFFLDLTQPGEMPPYGDLLPGSIRYVNLPIPDHSVPESPERMREIQRVLAGATGAGAVYVHCRAGIGRTGITVGCWLREQGRDPLQALEELNRLWRQNARAAGWPMVPETQAQELYIRNWGAAPPRAASGPLSRYRGCFVGLAVGDALAAADGSSAAGLAWTDDTAMTLCVAESLLACDGFDARDQLERYRAWAADPAAAGAAPGAKLRPVVAGVVSRALWSRAPMHGSHDPAQADPSPLARCAAVALYAGGRAGAASGFGADVARVTHQAPVVVDACRLFSVMIGLALAGAPRERVIAPADELKGMPLREDVRQLAAAWDEAPVGRRATPRGVLGALDRAVRAFSRSEGFDAGLARLAASGSPDRDALCAAYGALAGAFYGEAGIGEALGARVANLDRPARLAERLFRHRSMARAPVA